MQEHILVLIAWSVCCAVCGAVAALSFCRGAPQVPAKERPGPVRSGSPREPRERRCAQEEPAEASGQQMGSTRAARRNSVDTRIQIAFHADAPDTRVHSRSDCGHLKRAKHPIVERHLCKDCFPDMD